MDKTSEIIIKHVDRDITIALNIIDEFHEIMDECIEYFVKYYTVYPPKKPEFLN